MDNTSTGSEPRYLEDSYRQIDRFAVSAGHAFINDGEFPYSFLHINSGVCVLPVIEGTPEKSGEGHTAGTQTIVIRQYRFAVSDWQVELPAGAIDPGEEPAHAAARELTEETGFTARELVDLGPFHPSPGSTDETIYLFLARCDAQGGATHLDPSEDIRHRTVPLTELEHLIATGEFSHGAGMATWARATTRGLLPHS